MRRQTKLFRAQDVDISADETALAGAGVLWLLFSLVGLKFFRLRPAAALTGGLLAVVLHFASEIWHQLGHARAARQAGYPMERIEMWAVLGTSVYPEDEGLLPDRVHVQRALGGPKASALATLAGGVLAALVWPVGSIGRMVTTLFALDNLLVFTLGAFLPLRFPETDGTVLLRHLEEKPRPMVVFQE